MNNPILETVTERDFQDQVLRMAAMHGWTVYHTHDSRRSHKGWPDLVLVRDDVLLFRELKTVKGKPSKEQNDWIKKLTQTGADAGVWRPTDWDDIEDTLTRRRAA